MKWRVISESYNLESYVRTTPTPCPPFQTTAPNLLTLPMFAWANMRELCFYVTLSCQHLGSYKFLITLTRVMIQESYTTIGYIRSILLYYFHYITFCIYPTWLSLILAYDYVNVIDARYVWTGFEGFERFYLAFICIWGPVGLKRGYIPFCARKLK